jgi:hypothetical protein
MGLLRFLFAFLARLGPWVVLAILLFLVAIILTVAGAVFGFDLGDVDVWLQAHGGFFSAAGKLLLRLFFGFWLLICVFVAVSPLLFRKADSPERPGWGCILLAIPAAYVCWIGTFGDY